jgi:hypothetical protein
MIRIEYQLIGTENFKASMRLSKASYSFTSYFITYKRNGG